MSILIPLRARDGSVRDYAIIDEADADLAQYRWSLGAAGYAQRQTQKRSRKGPAVKRTKIVALHRVIAERMGIADAPMVDHEDRDKLSCRRYNLRPSDALLNARNRDPAGAALPRYFGCTADDCEGKHYALGMCRRHWTRVHERALRRRRAALRTGVAA